MAAAPGPSQDTRLAEPVRAARDGDRHALEQLVTLHTGPLAAFVRARAGDLVREQESVDDLVQSVCREALSDLSRIEYRGDREFRSWLFLLATRKILDRKKFYRRERRDIGRVAALPDAGVSRLLDAYGTVATPSRIASAREELARIENAIGELPEPQRDAVLYVKLLGIPYADVAERLGRSESAVRGLVARGLTELAERLRVEC